MLTLNTAVSALAHLLGTTSLTMQRFVRVLREDAHRFVNDIGKARKGGLVVRSVTNVVLTYEIVAGQPGARAVEAASGLAALRLAFRILRVPRPVPAGENVLLRPLQYDERPPVSVDDGLKLVAPLFLDEFERLARRAHRESRSDARFPSIRIIPGSLTTQLRAEIHWPDDKTGNISVYHFAVPDSSDKLPSLEELRKPQNWFSRKPVEIEYSGLRAFARLAAQAEDFNADLPTSSEPSPGSDGEGEGVAMPGNEKAPGTGIHEGLSYHPVSQTQAVTCDLAERSDSLPEQQSINQSVDVLSGSGPRVSAHRSVIRRAKPASRSSEHGTHWPLAAAP